MHRFLSLLVISLVLISCNDGDVVDFEFEFEDTFSSCGSTDVLFFKTKENPTETVTVAISNFTLQAIFDAEPDAATNVINRDATFTYRTYNRENLPNSLFCNNIPPANLNIEVDQSSSVSAIITRTLIEDDNDGILAIFEGQDPNGDGDYSDDISNNTIFIVYSDNGGLKDNKPLTGKKGTLTEGGIRVPLIFRYPGVIKANTITNQSVHCIDFLPTLAELTGVDLSTLKKPDGSSPQYDGVSFAKILKGEEKWLSRDNLFWHLPGYMDERFSPSTLIQTRIGSDYYKLFYFYETETFAMYHVNSDISEKKNLLNNPTKKQLKIALQMNANMLAWLKANKAPTGTWVKNGENVPYPKKDGVKAYKK
jgi:hypothetical protein